MKRFRFWLMAALVMIFAVFAASCDGASGGTAGETEHQHSTTLNMGVAANAARRTRVCILTSD